ncbi:MCE family protein [filamentous cyanobacterium LEGE 11480]|uniref:MCE family protein n=1 Tax=Romeriopsis navalis LEGE 11480 TaxID=2777977 RepID=A0A928VIU7_9CYAN|nr:MlaD family protein [Romeriopsis navalis]MBE9028553.1 MCE family protein [Romeriopsis navalis LEGE 11480]
MRSRIVREGSVGLLILAGVGIFGASIAWLKGLNPANRSFTVTVGFPTIAGVQSGSTVRYRGVSVGRIQEIKPSSNGVNVTISISPADLVIPADVEVTIDQSGLLGENVVNLTPQRRDVPQVAARPLDADCDKSVILCNGSRIGGDLGISTDALIKSTIKFADLYGQPEFYGNINQLTANSGKAAAEIATMSREFGILARAFRREIGTLSSTATSISGAANQAGLVANQAGRRLDQVGVTLDQLNGIILENRGTLVSTLENINQTSNSLKRSVNRLPATIDRFERSRLLNDLETLSANAAEASQNLKAASKTFNDPLTITTLQQTLEAARATFQNAQKITADLDELTGDPAVRKQFKDVIKGFGELLSSSQQLQQRAVYAQQLEPAAAQLSRKSMATTVAPPASGKSISAQRPVQPAALPIPTEKPNNLADRRSVTRSPESVVNPSSLTPQPAKAQPILPPTLYSEPLTSKTSMPKSPR